MVIITMHYGRRKLIFRQQSFRWNTPMVLFHHLVETRMRFLLMYSWTIQGIRSVKHRPPVWMPVWIRSWISSQKDCLQEAYSRLTIPATLTSIVPRLRTYITPQEESRMEHWSLNVHRVLLIWLTAIIAALPVSIILKEISITKESLAKTIVWPDYLMPTVRKIKTLIWIMMMTTPHWMKEFVPFLNVIRLFLLVLLILIRILICLNSM